MADELSSRLFPPKIPKVPERTMRWVEIRMIDDTGKTYAIREVGNPTDFVEQKDSIRESLKSKFMILLEKILP